MNRPVRQIPRAADVEAAIAAGEITREQAQGRRLRGKGKRTISLRVLMLEAPAQPTVIEEQRPRTRGDCVDGPRPCPWVGCKWHLYLDVARTGALILNFPDHEPDELVESCALDLADRGGLILEDVGAIYNVTRERVRQVQDEALEKIRGALYELHEGEVES
jgi:hypothetical protein